MPYVAEKIPLPHSLDRRRKLSDADRSEIEALYKSGKSIHALASLFNVARRTVSCIVKPESRETARKYVQEHWRMYQQKGEAWNAVQREHRAYKHRLRMEGELVPEGTVAGRVGSP